MINQHIKRLINKLKVLIDRNLHFYFESLKIKLFKYLN